MSGRLATAPAPATGTGVPEGAPALPPRVSWGAVFAGGFVAVATGAMLNILGLAIGATTLDPASGDSPSAMLLGISGGIWLIVANLIGLAVGGWVAARLSGTADDTDGMLHGLSVWAISFLVSLLLLGNVVAGATGTAVRGAASLLGGTIQGVGQAAEAVAPDISAVLDPEALAERLQQALEGGGNAAAMTSDQRLAAIARILGDRVREGEFEEGQRERLSQLVAAQYNVPADQVEARIDQLEARANQIASQAAMQARQAAETAAEATATGAYWVFAALILGAAAAVLGARIGTRRTLAAPGYG